MELVYLWVEDYKNIHKQGFNFSAKFRCEYDKDKNELTIEENENYIPDFFGENINVTAIVGKNGSGKSSVLENIIESYVFRKIIIYIDNGILYYDCDYTLDNKIKFNIKIEKGKFTHGYSDNKSKILCLGFNRRYYDDIFNTASNSIARDLNYSENQTIQNYFLLLKDGVNINNTKLVDFIKPDYIRIDRNEEFISGIIQSFHGNSFGRELEKKFQEDRNRNDFNYFYSFERMLILYLIKKYFKTIKDKDEYWDFVDAVKDKGFFYNKVNNSLLKWCDDLETNNDTIRKKFFKIIKYDDFNLDKFVSTTKLKKDGVYKLIFDDNLYFDFFKYDFATQNKKRIYSKLSKGEKDIFSQFINLYFEIEKQNYNEYLILFDEPNNTFHPEWQRAYIKEIITFFKLNFAKKKFHIVVSSHSPFIISDLPRENIIFLDTYKEDDEEVKKGLQQVGNCKVLSKDEVLEKKQTFGANIHTLLSDSFFMKDGLMGEFSKSKINEIKEFYKKVIEEKKTDDNIEFYNKNQEKFWQIQEIIGEPYLQKIIKNYLDELEILFSDDNTLIDKELKELEKRKEYLESLKK